MPPKGNPFCLQTQEFILPGRFCRGIFHLARRKMKRGEPFGKILPTLQAPRRRDFLLPRRISRV